MKLSLSDNAKLVAGITLLAVPTIMYGGLTLLGLLNGWRWLVWLRAGMSLDETQIGPLESRTCPRGRLDDLLTGTSGPD